MTPVYIVANALSVLVFLYFGSMCLFGDGMREDFERFGLSRLRRLTGALEVLGALGLVAGLFIHALAIVSGAALALLMVLGLVTRVRQRDSLIQMLPAAVLVAINVYIAWSAMGLRSV